MTKFRGFVNWPQYAMASGDAVLLRTHNVLARILRNAITVEMQMGNAIEVN